MLTFSIAIIAMLAVIAVFGVDINMSSIYGGNFMAIGNWVGLIAFAALLATLNYVCRNKKSA